MLRVLILMLILYSLNAQFQTAYFSNSLEKIYIFTNFTNISRDCNGNFNSYQWEIIDPLFCRARNGLFEVYLGFNSTILPLDILQINLNGSWDFYQVSPNVTLVAFPISLYGPTLIGLCDDLTLSVLVYNFDKRKVDFTWNVTSLANTRLINEYLSTLNQNSITVPNSFLESGTVYYFNVYVKNFIGVVSSSMINVEKRAEPLMVLVINPLPLKIYPSQHLSISSKILCGTCISDTTKLIKWTQTGGQNIVNFDNNPSVTLPTLYLKPFTFPNAGSYTFSITVTPNDVNLLSLTRNVTLIVENRKLFSKIQGGDCVISPNSLIELDSISYDPDKTSEVEIYDWRCVIESNPCDIILLPQKNQILQFMNKGNYTISLNYRKGSRNSTTSTWIYVQPFPIQLPTVKILGGNLQIINPLQKLVISANISSTQTYNQINYYWKQISGDLIPQDRILTYSNTLLIQPNSFNYGTISTWICLVTFNNIASSYAQVKIIVKDSPLIGIIESSTNQGNELTTEFSFKCSYFGKNNQYLEYSFGYKQPDGSIYPLQIYSHLNFIDNVYFGRSDVLDVYCFARDLFGGISSSSLKININSVTNQDSQLRLLYCQQNLNSLVNFIQNGELEESIRFSNSMITSLTYLELFNTTWCPNNCFESLNYGNCEIYDQDLSLMECHCINGRSGDDCIYDNDIQRVLTINLRSIIAQYSVNTLLLMIEIYEPTLDHLDLIISHLHTLSLKPFDYQNTNINDILNTTKKLLQWYEYSLNEKSSYYLLDLIGNFGYSASKLSLMKNDFLNDLIDMIKIGVMKGKILGENTTRIQTNILSIEMKIEELIYTMKGSILLSSIISPLIDYEIDLPINFTTDALRIATTSFSFIPINTLNENRFMNMIDIKVLNGSFQPINMMNNSYIFNVSIQCDKLFNNITEPDCTFWNGTNWSSDECNIIGYNLNNSLNISIPNSCYFSCSCQSANLFYSSLKLKETIIPPTILPKDFTTIITCTSIIGVYLFGILFFVINEHFKDQTKYLYEKHENFTRILLQLKKSYFFLSIFDVDEDLTPLHKWNLLFIQLFGVMAGCGIIYVNPIYVGKNIVPFPVVGLFGLLFSQVFTFLFSYLFSHTVKKKKGKFPIEKIKFQNLPSIKNTFFVKTILKFKNTFLSSGDDMIMELKGYYAKEYKIGSVSIHLKIVWCAIFFILTSLLYFIIIIAYSLILYFFLSFNVTGIINFILGFIILYIISIQIYYFKLKTQNYVQGVFTPWFSLKEFGIFNLILWILYILIQFIIGMTLLVVGVTLKPISIEILSIGILFFLSFIFSMGYVFLLICNPQFYYKEKKKMTTIDPEYKFKTDSLLVKIIIYLFVFLFIGSIFSFLIGAGFRFDSQLNQPQYWIYSILIGILFQFLFGNTMFFLINVFGFECLGVIFQFLFFREDNGKYIIFPRMIYLSRKKDFQTALTLIRKLTSQKINSIDEISSSNVTILFKDESKEEELPVLTRRGGEDVKSIDINELFCNSAKNKNVEACLNILEEKSLSYTWVDTNTKLPLFHTVVKHSLLKVAEKMLEKGFNVNQITKECISPLHCAVISGNQDMVLFLLGNKASVTEKNSLGWTPLFISLKIHHFHLVNDLILFGSDINSKRDNGYTIVHHTLLNNDEILLDYLLNMKNLKFNFKDHNGRTPLLRSIENITLPIWKKYINHSQVDCLASDENGKNIFHLIVEYDRTDLLDYFLNLENMDKFKNLLLGKEKLKEQTPLHMALNVSDDKMKDLFYRLIKLYEKEKLDYNVKDKFGDTPHEIILKKIEAKYIEECEKKSAPKSVEIWKKMNSVHLEIESYFYCISQ